MLRLDHLDADAARAAILEPLDAFAALGGPGVVAEPALVAAIVDQVASGRIESRLAGRGIVESGSRRGRIEAAYLQLVLERLWEVERQRGSDVLRAATLAELGGAGRIVQEHLQRALAGLDEPERELASRLFNHLVTPSGTKIAHGLDDLGRYAGDDRRRIEPVLRALSGERVVRPLPAKNGGGTRYEIYHDVLAAAVLDWRNRHEAERQLAEEREAARKRHRRLAAIAALSIAALAAMVVLTLYAFSQRSEAERQAQLASEQQQAAEQAASDALEAKADAEASARDAEAQRAAARRAERRALRAQDTATQQRDAARRARDDSRRARDDATQQAAIARGARDEADRQRAAAVAAQGTTRAATRRRRSGAGGRGATT